MSRRGDQIVITNRKARHDYLILDVWECGIVLLGSEVKSIRESRANLLDAYARVENGEVWMYGMHVQQYSFSQGEHDPVRRRKLLLNAVEIRKLIGLVEQKGFTLVPLILHFSKGNVKCEIGLARGKKQHDKRATTKEREWEIQKARIARGDLQ